VRKTVSRFAVLTLGVSVLVACSGSTEGSPELGETSSQATTSTRNSGVRLAVEDPLDVGPFLSRPCDLLPEEALSSAGLNAQSGEASLPENDPAAKATGPYCSWIGDNASASVGVQSENTKRGMGGLDGLYAVYEQGRYEFWEETEVASYPAAFAASVDLRSEGRCQLAVGIADDMSFTANAYVGDDPQSACQVATELAAQVIETLKGAR
jgi:hypothetical protein